MLIHTKSELYIYIYTHIVKLFHNFGSKAELLLVACLNYMPLCVLLLIVRKGSWYIYIYIYDGETLWSRALTIELFFVSKKDWKSSSFDCFTLSHKLMACGALVSVLFICFFLYIFKSDQFFFWHISKRIKWFFFWILWKLY